MEHDRIDFDVFTRRGERAGDPGDVGLHRDLEVKIENTKDVIKIFVMQWLMDKPRPWVIIPHNAKSLSSQKLMDFLGELCIAVVPPPAQEWWSHDIVEHAIGLQRSSNVWNNFITHQVRPTPSDHMNPGTLHFLVEGPRDRHAEESLVLVEIREIRRFAQPSRDVWRVRSALTRSDLIQELDLVFECGRLEDRCLILLAGEPWAPNDRTLHVVLSGALIKVSFDLNSPETECLSRSTSNHGRSPRLRSRSSFHSQESSRDLRDPSDEGGTLQSDSYSLMQLNDISHITREVDDQVFRLLCNRLDFFQLPREHGFCISVWVAPALNTVDSWEHRVWLGRDIPSWTTRCLDVTLYPNERSAHAEADTVFVLVTPSPHSLRVSNNHR